MKFESRDYHPERFPDEIFLCNHPEDQSLEIYGWESKRLGRNAYDITAEHKPVRGMRPVFILCEEYIKKRGEEQFRKMYPDTAVEYFALLENTGKT